MLEFNDLDDAPPIVLNVMDKDPKSFFSSGADDGANDDYIGRCIIFLDKIGKINDPTTHISEDDVIPTPCWYPVKFAMNSPYSEENGGRILLSFAKIDFHDSFAIAPEVIELDNATKKFPLWANTLEAILLNMPDLKIRTMNVDINVLGLRDLVTPGLLPIKKAYIKFSVKSLLPPAQAKAVHEIHTDPGPSGADPNI